MRIELPDRQVLRDILLIYDILFQTYHRHFSCNIIFIILLSKNIATVILTLQLIIFIQGKILLRY